MASAVATEDAGLKKASQRIAALHPPSVVTHLNADIVRSFNLYEKSVAQFEQALRSGTHQQLAAQAAAVKASKQAFLTNLTQIATQLRAKGIPLPGP